MKKAFTVARSGDTVLVTGMGHQDYMTIATGKISWNDARVSRELLVELGKANKK
jgi:UDP-N-acetylmuramoyl-L-alanyl-D-glutamate--2,6-diaminopimelate ligase